MTTKNKQRMYGIIFRARKKGSRIITKERTILRDYNADYPPPAARSNFDERV
jgi:hypothetical protein